VGGWAVVVGWFGGKDDGKRIAIASGVKALCQLGCTKDTNSPNATNGVAQWTQIMEVSDKIKVSYLNS